MKPLRTVVSERLDVLSSKPRTSYGCIGNLSTGVIQKPGTRWTIYVTLQSGIIEEVLNVRVPNILGQPVIIGRDPGNMPNITQVLSVWNVYNDNDMPALGTAFHRTQHEWPNGDTPYVHGEIFYPSLYQPVVGAPSVVIYPGTYLTTTGWIEIKIKTTLDLTSSVPTTTNKARYTMIVVNSAGDFTLRDGSEVTGWENLTSADMPAPVPGDNCICMVKIYANQTEFRKNGQMNDFTDLRFTGARVRTVYSTALDELSDVTLDTPAEGQYLTYDETPGVWRNTYTGKVDLDIYRFGFVAAYDGTQETTIAFDGINTFTLAPTGTVWHYYRNGIRYTVTGSKTVVLSGSPPAAKGLYYIYIDSTDGTLSASTTIWTLEDTKLSVATISWDNALTPKYWLADERHTVAIDRRYHWEHHSADGTEIVTAPTISGYSVAPSSPTDANNTFGISQSIIADEDLKIILAALTDPNGATPAYTIFYRTAAAVWDWAFSEVPFAYTAASYIKWDNAGTMTTGAVNKFYTSYLLLTNKLGDARFAVINGQGEYSTLGAAQAETFSSLVKTGIAISEFVACYQLIWETSAAYTTKGKCRMAVAPKVISISASGAGSSGSYDHNSLTGIQGGTPGEYYHLTASQQTEFIAIPTTYLKLDLTNAPLTGTSLTWNGNAARDITLNRHTTADTAGSGLVLQAGGATVGATDKAGGTLRLRSGISTGSGASSILLQTPTPGASGTADNSTYVTRVTINNSGVVVVGNISATNLSGTNTGDQTLPTDQTIVTSDNTDNNVSTSKHGWFPKLPTPTGKFLKDDATWDTPTVGSVAWGSITGTLASQTDLQTALDARLKLDLSNSPITGQNFLWNGDTDKYFTMQRHSVSNTDGNDLWVIAGGSTDSSTDKNGGDLYISSGLSTGLGTGKVYIGTSGDASGVSGTYTNGIDIRLAIDYTGAVFTVPIAATNLSGSNSGDVTLGTNTASALSLSGQQLSLADKFVQNTGDTMTGALTLDVTTGTASTSGTAMTLRGTAPSGTPAAGLGVDLIGRLQMDDLSYGAASLIRTSWGTATSGSQKARLTFFAYDTGARNCLQLGADGSAAMIGFLGTSAVAKAAALTTVLTAPTATAAGTPDYAWGGGTSGGYGFSSADEFRTMAAVIINLRTRLGELESRLQTYGLLS